jgi:PHD/YefM family antitoxin component YafN of YafNO toxin-antitoxin module
MVGKLVEFNQAVMIAAKGRGRMDARRDAMQKNVQFVIDTEGHRKAVILPIEEYEEMMEDLHMGRAACESKSQPHRPFEDVIKELRATDEIDV